MSRTHKKICINLTINVYTVKNILLRVILNRDKFNLLHRQPRKPSKRCDFWDRWDNNPVHKVTKELLQLNFARRNRLLAWIPGQIDIYALIAHFYSMCTRIEVTHVIITDYYDLTYSVYSTMYTHSQQAWWITIVLAIV